MNTNVETLIHVSEVMDTEARDVISRELHCVPGVTEMQFAREGDHVILVGYDPEVISAHRILEAVRYHGFSAQLVGL